jgi:DNA-binding MarR family transcriptional regulator
MPKIGVQKHPWDNEMAKRTGPPQSTAVKNATALKPDGADYRALAEFRFALRQFLEFSGDAARGVGLTPQQHQALLTIKAAAHEAESDDAPMTVGRLAERLLLKHHSAVELVDRLGALELVQRKPDAKDRRKVALVLTRKAERLLTSLSAAHLEELRRIRPAFAALLERLDG